ncbi:MAG: hypothetical protein JW744_04275, partial [Candidatus Diapherotrites archaeon]|nr:hypothetical protein [Candidatus Diapherotrites archaeon]
NLCMGPGRMMGVPISEAEARIVAHVCGDGCIFSFLGKRYLNKSSPPRKNMTRMQYGVSFCNTEPSLINSFSDDVYKVYGRKAYKTKEHEVGLKAKWIYQRLKCLGAGKSREWFVCDEILKAEKPIIREWLRAFFDDEAYVDLRDFRISVNSVNPNGLKQAQEMLKKFGIENTSFNGPYRYKKCISYRLTILKEDVERFRVYIGFNHPKKVRDLEELLDLRAMTL